MEITSKLIKINLGFSRQQLYYWREKGVIHPPVKSSGGHFRYSFQDLVTLKTIKLLRDQGITIFQIRKCFEQIRQLFPNVEQPFSENQILAFREKVVYVHKGHAYDALTGQAYLLDFQKVEEWAGEVIGLIIQRNNELSADNDLQRMRKCAFMHKG